MHQIQWVSHRLLISAYYRRLFHVSPKSKIANWASPSSRRWSNERSKRAKSFTATTTTALWFVYLFLDFHLNFCEEKKYFRNFQNFFIDFSKRCGPCLMSRSVLQCLYFPQSNMVFGVTPMAEMLRDSAKFFCAPNILVSKNPSQVCRPSIPIPIIWAWATVSNGEAINWHK